MGPDYIQGLADVYVMTGDYDRALDQIEYLLSIPSYFSISALQLNPEFDPLRNHPRYQKLVAKFSRPGG